MHKISLTGLGIAGAIQDINRYFETVAPIPFRIKEAKEQTSTKTDRANPVVRPTVLPLPDAWKQPCGTCGLECGWQSKADPQYIWCINTECPDFHTTFTIEEWQERGRTKADLDDARD